MENNNQQILLLEKVLMLRSVSMFQGTSETILAQIADIMEECPVHKEQVLFQEGAIGDCMYIVYSGEVRIHTGEHTLAAFKKNDFFGELSLLSSDTRTATATCSTDGMMYVIHQEDFYDILDAQPQVTRAILRELCERVRATDAQLLALSKS
jgi:CRP-like cAMP-binding protein